MSLQLRKRFILTYNLVINISLFTVFHVTARDVYNLRFPVSGYHIDLCRL